MLDKDRIIGKIDKITKGVEYTPSTYAPKLPPGMQAEQLWGLICDYSAVYAPFYRENLREVLNGRSIKTVTNNDRQLANVYTEGESDIINLAQEISGLWQNPAVKRTFESKLSDSANQLNNYNDHLNFYRRSKKGSERLDKERRTALAKKFKGQIKSPQLWKINLSRNKTVSASKKLIISAYESKGGMPAEAEASKGGIDKPHADLAAIVAFQRIIDYRQQLKEAHFIMTPSRVALLDHVVETVAKGNWVLLSGETGTGKSQLAKTISHILNGEPPLYASGEKFSDTRTLVGVRSMDPMGAYYDFGPLTSSLTGCFDSRAMAAELRQPNPDGIKGKLLQLDEINKFDQDALMGSLNLASTYRPGEFFTMSQLPGVQLRKALTGSAIIATMNPANVRYDRKELDPSIVRRFQDGTVSVDYLGMSPQNPELYEAFLAALMDDNGRIRISSSELAPTYKPVEDPTTKITKQVLDTNVVNHGFLYRFALATHEVHKSFKHEANVGTTPSNAQFMEKYVLDMEILMKWMEGFEMQVDSGITFESYIQSNINRFYENIDTPEDQDTFKKIMSHFDIPVDYQNPKMIQSYEPMTPLEIGYLSPKVPRAVKKVVTSTVEKPKVKVYMNPSTGQQNDYIDQPATLNGKTYNHGDIFISNGKRIKYIGIHAQKPDKWVTEELDS